MRNQRQNKRILIFAILLTSILYIISAITILGHERVQLPCKKFPKGVTSKQLENELEQERRGESSFSSRGELTCREALPLLRKYALDPNPEIRDIVSEALHRAFYDYKKSFYPEVFRVLLLQIEKFPIDGSATTVFYAASRPCYLFQNIQSEKLINTLISRINYQSKEFNKNEIYILGCLSSHEPKAKKILQEMSKPDYPTQLDESERDNQLNILTHALAEAGIKEAEDAVLAEIEELFAIPDGYKIQNSSGILRGFTNCRIIERFIAFLHDKRVVSVADYQGGENRQLKARVGDLIIPQLTSLYGGKVTGEKDVYVRVHSDSEIDKIYKSIKSFVKGKVYNSCSM